MHESILSSTASRHPAVQRCIDAGKAAHAQASTQRHTPFERELIFEEAYLQAIPDLSSPENIRDFMACVSYALIADIIYSTEAREYLHMAKAALPAVRRVAASPAQP